MNNTLEQVVAQTDQIKLGTGQASPEVLWWVLALLGEEFLRRGEYDLAERTAEISDKLDEMVA